MATTNIEVTSDWTKVADDTDTSVLIQPASDSVKWEVASVATETVPVVKGHPVKGHEQTVTRSLMGAGFLYVKATNVNTATFIVSLSE